MSSVEIISFNENHWQNRWNDIKRIYEEGITTGMATFETKSPSWEEWNKKYLQICRLAAVSDNEICGWTALSPVSSREVYKGVCDEAIYVSEKHRGKGIGKLLLQALIKESEANGIWTLQAGIFCDNKSSITLHLKNGFRIVGTREKIGQLNGKWKDTILLERRSKIINYI
ncbi:MAG: N-acetyltransferase [Bacteroidetes bacterium]|nr:N-acetyltransferase [Bacteroidota bacterium]